MKPAEIRSLLADHVSGPIRIVSINPFEDEVDSNGMRVSDREVYRRLWQGRLERVWSVGPKLSKVHSDIQSVLDRLDSVGPEDRLFYWEVESPAKSVSGVSSRSVILHIYESDLHEKEGSNQ